ncbi:MAG: DMT family transporter [Rhizobiales bacterium]|nr:DMT family transporter [Hyphomicrobiales bacterium]
MTDTAIPETRNRVFVGIGLTSLGYFLFSCQDVFIKLLVEHITVWQILFVRSLVVLCGCLAAGGPPLVTATWRSPIFQPMLLRSFLILAAWLSYYNAARYLQLAELTTIYFAAPVIVTLLSIFLLGEKVPMLRWAAVLMGFAGVFIACDPARLGISLPVAMVLAAAFLWGLAIVLLRKTALRERTIIQIILNNAFFLVFAGIPTIFLWQTPTLPQFLMLAAIGLISGIAQLALYEGMRYADASIIASFEYMALIWAFVFGYLVWGDVPRREVFIGAALIVGAGLVIVGNERMRLRR